MEEDKFTTTGGVALFRHTPLEKHDDTIRLVQVLPDLSDDGLPRCTIELARSLQSPYVCLSYAWGDPGDEHPIRINDELIFVRRNLWDFLMAARKRFTFCRLWIDALCIDQANVGERNQQVQQMGDVFSRAKMVVAWLGVDTTIVELFTELDKRLNLQTWSTWENYHHRESHILPSQTLHEEHDKYAHIGIWYPQDLTTSTDVFTEFSASFLTLQQNSYWSRAWITQEIMQARAIVVVAGESAIDFVNLAAAHSRAMLDLKRNDQSSLADFAMHIRVRRGFFYRYFRRQEFQLAGRVLMNNSAIEGWGMITLLHRFRQKDCTLERDRIYSLRSLCEDGDRVKVDYSATEEEVVLQVLNAYKKSLCFCSTATAALILGYGSIPPWQKRETSRAVQELWVRGYPLSSELCDCCHQWTPRSWDGKRGVYFCLKTICNESHGHLLWENTSGIACEQKCIVGDTMHFQPFPRASGLETRDLPENVGITIKRTKFDSFYIVEFTLDAVIDIMQDQRAGK